jgi:hypothetical protein
MTENIRNEVSAISPGELRVITNLYGGVRSVRERMQIIFNIYCNFLSVSYILIVIDRLSIAAAA